MRPSNLRFAVEFILSVVLLALLTAFVAAQDHTESYTVTIRYDENSDPHFSYFRLAFSDGTSVLVIGDDDLPFTKWLTEHKNKKLRINLFQQERLER
jgi:hypothetical protein